jgi:hypothetical protein
MGLQDKFYLNSVMHIKVDRNTMEKKIQSSIKWHIKVGITSQNWSKAILCISYQWRTESQPKKNWKEEWI